MNLRRTLETILETILVVLLLAMALLVVAAVVFRRLGSALVWYDEVASILLAWLTYYGASLAFLKQSHIGFPVLIQRLSPPIRRLAIAVRETIVVGFLLLLAWAGFQVVEAMSGTYLVSLPWVPEAVALSVIPIGAVLSILGELAGLPGRFPGSPEGGTQ